MNDQYYHSGGGLTSIGVKAYEDHLSEISCPICKHSEWKTGDRVANLNGRLGMDFPAVLSVCGNCSYVLALAPPPYPARQS